MTVQIQLRRDLQSAPLRTHFRVDERVEKREAEFVTLFTWIGYAERRFALWEDESPPLLLHPRFLRGVFARYAYPLEKVGDITARLRLPGGEGELFHMLFVPDFDVVPKDYLVWLPTEGEAMVGLCAELVPPLRHLARAATTKQL